MSIKSLFRGVSHLLPDKVYIKLKYRSRLKKKLNLKNPQTFNEKLQWLKLYDRNPEYIKLVDKYEVKKYIEEKLGKEYIIPTLGVWDKFEDIDFDKLPNQFVLKCTHDSGGLVICDDKSKLDLDEAKKKINQSLKTNYFWLGREWPYKSVKPRIIAEKFMVDESGYELKDYKFFCFNGEPKIIQVDFDRYTEHKKNLYTTDWKLCEFSFNYPAHPEIEIKKPEKLEKMIELAKVLAEGKPYVRIDFYSISGEIFFGEITFFPASGMGRFEPDKYDYELGQMIKLPIKNKN